MSTMLAPMYPLQAHDFILHEPNTPYVLRFHDLPDNEKPREKLLASGAKHLTAAELVAVVVVLFSFINLFVLAIDTFCLLAGGIYALLGSLELRTEHPIHVHWPRVSLPIHPLIELRLHHRTRSIA